MTSFSIRKAFNSLAALGSEYAFNWICPHFPLPLVTNFTTRKNCSTYECKKQAALSASNGVITFCLWLRAVIICFLLHFTLWSLLPHGWITVIASTTHLYKSRIWTIFHWDFLPTFFSCISKHFPISYSPMKTKWWMRMCPVFVRH